MKINFSKKSKSILGLCTTLGFVLLSTKAKADLSTVGLFVEPMVTYESGDTTVNYPSPISDSTGDIKGYGIGARLGVHVFETFFVGLDGRYSRPKYKDSTGYDSTAVSTNWGPVAGVQMPIAGLRVWGGYLWDGRINPEKSGDFNIDYSEGRGYRVGAGFHVATVSLNIEYQEIKYGNTSLEDVGPFSPGASFSSVDLTNKSWVGSVSFPVEL